MDYDTIVGSIYDCAANPELWPSTLVAIRDHLRSDFVMAGFADMSPLDQQQSPTFVFHNSPWDVEWLMRLEKLLPIVPKYELAMQVDVDNCWTQMQHMSEDEFRQTEFYRAWVQPKRLRDCLMMPYLKRSKIMGLVSTARHEDNGLFEAEHRVLMERISPHLRRAMAINDIVDKGRLATALYRSVIDSMLAPVLVIGLGRKLVFANEAGSALLSKGDLLQLQGGAVFERRSGRGISALEAALERAIKGDSAVGIAGIGVPLVGKDGRRAAAYVLPIAGKDLRGDLGQGYAALFVAQRGEQQPILLEVLRTIFDLTPAEARVAALVAQGESPAAIADVVGVSVHTVRTHLARCFAKTGAQDQPSLGALVNGLLPPVGV